MTIVSNVARKPRRQPLMLPSYQRLSTACILRAPIILISEMNARDHWSKLRKRRIQQQSALCLCLQALCDVRSAEVSSITLRRVGKKMDADNNVSSFKHVQDEIAAWLMTDDANIPWKYDQGRPLSLQLADPPALAGSGLEIYFWLKGWAAS
jgi:hypothetical protein